jgi:hypothetical protein
MGGAWYLQWYIVGLVGGVLLPWLIFTKTLLNGFARGFRKGLEAWLGMCWFSVFIMLAAMLVLHLAMAL